ncbi:flagellar basal body-associated FliL family protein [Ketogulonicigenium vulgare]|uniref:Flagellar motor protein MotA n=1 Tax=Ketogulonicigenium vulgare (strain WSH-001) TaxID=759362 RepID=F9Y4G4_KETVW|nr:flagellar basal body-associated FliL family protein [Ketogulonicigenium vulgare]ADO43498.1 flagellar motor protein MotA [Ketogulonicigenium vulgare Y25]AEM41777.1 Flagellar motor protein MotA [Ketogulonicigenium vulgare WSH-001]ALJ81883.1 flagellar motor protein MotA [Ketogulonicigenium vulgare]ANW34532.1 flagellar motor protein MotA [Ketogulonicigenium vulgare]AOZ55533.1 flagellar motor protein MotA [Ketogulonicigenium vulgare]
MKKILLPMILTVIGTASGIGAGIITARPAVEAVPTIIPPTHTYVPLDEPFVVPILRDEMTRAIVVAALGIEIDAAQASIVAPAMPKLRDQFLQVLYDHANTGGFDGLFTAPDVMRRLRDRLKSAAVETLGNGVHDILVTDLSRQEY